MGQNLWLLPNFTEKSMQTKKTNATISCIYKSTAIFECFTFLLMNHVLNLERNHWKFLSTDSKQKKLLKVISNFWNTKIVFSLV